jgi:hypothetical protein
MWLFLKEKRISLMESCCVIKLLSVLKLIVEIFAGVKNLWVSEKKSKVEDDAHDLKPNRKSNRRKFNKNGIKVREKPPDGLERNNYTMVSKKTVSKRRNFNDVEKTNIIGLYKKDFCNEDDGISTCNFLI